MPPRAGPKQGVETVAFWIKGPIGVSDIEQLALSAVFRFEEMDLHLDLQPCRLLPRNPDV